METKHMNDCFGKFGYERWEPEMGSWNKGVFVFVFKVEETLTTYKCLGEGLSRERGD